MSMSAVSALRGRFDAAEVATAGTSEAAIAAVGRCVGSLWADYTAAEVATDDSFAAVVAYLAATDLFFFSCQEAVACRSPCSNFADAFET